MTARAKAVVRKGDVIFNPPWWRYEVKNKSPFSIGFSSRWLLQSLSCTNSLFELTSYLSPDLLRIKRYTVVGTCQRRAVAPSDCLAWVLPRKRLASLMRRACGAGPRRHGDAGT